MNSEFETYMLNDMGKRKAKHIANKLNECLESLKEVCPDSRCFSVAKTKLEEACFFAKKSMAQDKENCQ